MAVSEISPESLAQKLAGPPDQRPVLVDVRSPEEHDHVAIPGSLLLPLQEIDAHEDKVRGLLGREVVVYCHHGMRSQKGAAYLASRGVRATSLAGGIDAYSLKVDPKLRRY
jgi:rhodanese-related sulfurtransferase